MNFSEGIFQYLFVLAVNTAIWSISSSVPLKTAWLSARQNYRDEFHVFTTPKPLSQLKHRVKPFIWIRYTVPPDDHTEKYSETEIQLSIYMPIVLITLVCFVCFILIRKHCILSRNESVPTAPPSRIISLSSTINRQTSQNLSNVSYRRNSEATFSTRQNARMASRTRNLRDTPPDYFEVVNTDKKQNKYPAVPLGTLQIPPPNYDESMKY